MKHLEDSKSHTIKSLNILDRGLAYGDGLFETIAYVGGQLNHWALHWQRLKLGAQQLSISLPEEQFFLDNIFLEIDNELQLSETNKANKVIKIIVTRGQGGRGYLYSERQESSIIITVHNWPERSLQDYQYGIHATLCMTCLAKQPALAGIKHLNRLEQVLGRNEFNITQYQEGIMTECPDAVLNNSINMDSIVIEGTSSNLFFVINDRLLTPLIDTCGVRGTMRESVIFLAAELGIATDEGTYSLNDLMSASEVFFTNSIWGILPVASIEFQGELKWNLSLDDISNKNKDCFTNKIAMTLNKQIERPEGLTLADL